MTLDELPAVNATLNALSTVLIIGGLISIKAGRRSVHGWFMSFALFTSAAFLTCYLIYHATHPPKNSAYMSELAAWVRPTYLFILITHVVLAAANLPMIIATVIPVIRKRFEIHRRRARWAYPIWLYVSVTGVIVYLWLYIWFPAPA